MMLLLASLLVECRGLWFKVYAVRMLDWFPLFLRVVCWLPCCFCCPPSDMLIILENTLVGYADDSSLLAEVPESVSNVSAVVPFNRGLARICDLCNAGECWYIL